MSCINILLASQGDILNLKTLKKKLCNFNANIGFNREPLRYTYRQTVPM
jgi:hypothetical protein